MRNDEVRIACECTSKDVVVGRVFLNNIRDGLRDDDFTAFGNRFQTNANIVLVPVEPSKDVRHLVYDEGRNNELVRPSLRLLHEVG